MSDRTGLLTDVTGRPRWVRRVVVAAALTGVAYGVATVVELEPRLLPLGLIAVVVVLALGVLSQAVLPSALVWYPAVVRPSVFRGRDGVTLAHARHLETHLTDRRPDGVLRDRLATLADQVLYARHGESLRTARGRELLGAEVAEVLTGPARRLSLRTIDTCVHAIEEL